MKLDNPEVEQARIEARAMMLEEHATGTQFHSIAEKRGIRDLKTATCGSRSRTSGCLTGNDSIPGLGHC
jgi:hypothetical protein